MSCPDAEPNALLIPASALPDEDGSVAYSERRWNILICRSADQFFVVENRCTHREQKLEGGRVRRGYIFCPHHGARFALATGAPCGPPASSALKTFPCRQASAGLIIDLPPH